ncbi:MAG: DUF2244 domain-containing protein [Sphingomonadales bacterium]|jgi:uncharacterized membrane protein
MAEETKFLDIVLSPSRSLSPRGFAWLMGVLGLLSLCVGGFFLSIGAWPVFGFFGLDVLLLYLAFRVNFRDGEVREHVTLDSRDLAVTRTGPKEKSQSHHFQPAWVKVEVYKHPGQVAKLQLRTQGKSLIIGDFLPPNEITQVADIIDKALAQRAKALIAI